jgi:hypothetical protein
MILNRHASLAPSIFTPGTAEKLSAQWGKGPVVFRNALCAPIFTKREFMAGVVGATREFATNPEVPSGRVFIDGKAAKPDQLRPFLVDGDEQTFEQYVAGIREALPRKEVSIILDKCEKHMSSVRQRITPLLHDLFSHVGYPARANHACIYAGTYKTTPFGIHRDDCHVLMFCGAGSKKMAIWPRSYFDSVNDASESDKIRARVSEHLAQAVILEINPLDIMYWSAEDWHVGISESDEFGAALSMGIYHHASSAETFMSMKFFPTPKYKSMSEAYKALDIHGIRVISKEKLSTAELKSTDLAGFFDHWTRISEILSNPNEVEYYAMDFVLTLLTSAGFGKLLSSPPHLQNLEGTTLICEVPQALVAASVRAGLLVGANGSVFFYDNHLAEIENLLANLRTGVEIIFNDILISAAAGWQDMLGSVIRDLIIAGAVSFVKANTQAVTSSNSLGLGKPIT